MTNIIQMATEKMVIAHHRKLLARKQEWARQLEDQVRSGQMGLERVYRDITQLQAELHLLEDADDLIARATA